MASHIIVASLVALFCIAQPGFSRPEQAAVPNIQDLIKEMETTVKKTFDEAKKSLNLPNDPNGEAVVKAVKEQGQKAEQALKDMRTKIEQQIKSNPQIQDAIKGLQAKVDEAAASLKKENPEVAANAQKILDNVKSAYESVGKEMEKVNSEISKKGGLKDDLESLFKNLIDRGNVYANQLKSQIDEALKKKA
ncbi:reticulocyte-binding protein 1 [Halyomorpha halys]|uniref:reticulocyte-binding protein 1 n=1 Tax=Halyomorpha halys TaxID=286706 RepID=UPI0006D521F7|nr:uncharacterized protein LOC106683993 [Halyomorpha halys]